MVAMLPLTAARLELSTVGFLPFGTRLAGRHGGLGSFRCGWFDRGSVLLFDRHAEVYGREEREDICLEPGDEYLEQRERDARGEGQRGDALECPGRLEDEELRRGEAEHQDEVPGDHVRGEPERERGRT